MPQGIILARTVLVGKERALRWHPQERHEARGGHGDQGQEDYVIPLAREVQAVEPASFSAELHLSRSSTHPAPGKQP